MLPQNLMMYLGLMLFLGGYIRVEIQKIFDNWGLGFLLLGSLYFWIAIVCLVILALVSAFK